MLPAQVLVLNWNKRKVFIIICLSFYIQKSDLVSFSPFLWVEKVLFLTHEKYVVGPNFLNSVITKFKVTAEFEVKNN